MQIRGWALSLLLAGMVWSLTAAQATTANSYRTVRDASCVTTFDAKEQVASLFTSRAGQIIELQGVVCGTVNGTTTNSFLLRIGEQTVMVSVPNVDPDIEVGNTLRVLARVPAQGQLLECLAVTSPDQETNADAARPAPNEMPVASRPPETFPTNPDTAPSPPPAENPTAPQPGITRQYAERIRIWNSRVTDDTATKIATCLLDRCSRYSVDPRLMFALIAQESRFSSTAVSCSGAQGLGQLMPGTADYLGVRHAFDIEDNLDGAVRYLAEQMRTFGRLSLALAAYNAGPKAVKRYGGIPPYHETQHYVRVIWQTYCALAGMDPSTADIYAMK